MIELEKRYLGAGAPAQEHKFKKELKSAHGSVDKVQAAPVRDPTRAQSPTRARSPGGQFDHRSAMVALYQKVDPSKVGAVDKALEAYAGKEAQMWGILKQKYGAEAVPPPGFPMGAQAGGSVPARGQMPRAKSPTKSPPPKAKADPQAPPAGQEETAMREVREVKKPTRMEGSLMKKGSGTSAFGRRNWNKRYIVLEGGFICYYTSYNAGKDDQVKIVKIYDDLGRNAHRFKVPNKHYKDPNTGEEVPYEPVRIFERPKMQMPNRVVIEVDLLHHKTPTLFFALDEPEQGEVNTWATAFRKHVAYYGLEGKNPPDAGCESYRLAIHGSKR